MGIENLPQELIYTILTHLSNQPALGRSNHQAELVRLGSTARIFQFPVQSILINYPQFNHLDSLDSLIQSFELEERKLRGIELEEEIQFDNYYDHLSQLSSSRVISIIIKCTEFGIKGWGNRVGKIMANARFLSQITLFGIEDLRIKQIIGTGHLKSLTLKSTTFRAHSLPNSPHLAFALASLTHLTLDNLGLPAPSTHFNNLLEAAVNLTHLSISDLRDLTVEMLQCSLESTQSRLLSLSIGNLTVPQQLILHDLLPSFSKLHSLTFNSPLPTTIILQSIPKTVKTLTIKKSKLSNPILEAEITNHIIDTLADSSYCKGLAELNMFHSRGLGKIESICQVRNCKPTFY